MLGELISVKEYAERKGITEQAVYKQIRAGALQSVEQTESGKAKKYIFVPTAESQDTGDHPDPAPAAAESQDTGTAAAALAEIAIKALTAQLEEKDKQIERLTQLLDNSQQLQAHSQKLLEQPTDTGTAADELKKSGWLSRVFGL